MIPTIPEIIAGLIAGDYTAAQAQAWMDQHQVLAAQAGDMLDAFAASVIQGFCANPSIFAPSTQLGWSLAGCTEPELCGTAYRLAAEMVRARAAA